MFPRNGFFRIETLEFNNSVLWMIYKCYFIFRNLNNYGRYIGNYYY